MRVRITAGDRQAEAEIRDFHDQIIRLTLDGKDLEAHPLLFNVLQDKEPDRANVEEWIKGLILNELVWPLWISWMMRIENFSKRGGGCQYAAG
ncbi:hypothetical protein [Desulfobacter hydrogenophilus]|uniref:hypothetical protein n=1 Tax=Desulfobacter hydrogenophilus TaxID=2291 RepID=UPI001F5FA9D9|nr:hypothetical protein [Desulfobacter hydrogenophilus]